MERIKQVMANLISNSIKYSVKGTITLEVHSLHTLDGGRRIQIKVRDQGIGIKGDLLKTLGHMFTQLEVKDNVNQSGIGFGLTISKMIIEKIGGTLSIKTNSSSNVTSKHESSNKGMQVIIEFPDMTNSTISEEMRVEEDESKSSVSSEDSIKDTKVIQISLLDS